MRDLEFQTYFWSQCPQFSEKIEKEKAVIEAACAEVSSNTFHDTAFQCGVASRVLASGLSRFL